MFLTLILRILAVFLMIAAGFAARRMRILTDDAAQSLARSITVFFYPALIFSSMTANFTAGGLAANWVLPAGAAAIMAVGWLFGLGFSRLLAFRTPAERNVFLFQATINNYSYLPMPIIEMLWGPAGVGRLMFSTLGSETAVWTIGVLGLGGNRFRPENLRRLLSVPMVSLFAAVAAILLRDRTHVLSSAIFRAPLVVEAGPAFFAALSMFGRGAVPLAMFVAGGRMADITPDQILSVRHATVAALRLAVIPAAALALLLLLPIDRTAAAVLAVVAVMPCSIASIVLTETYGADTRFAASTVLATHVLSLATIPAWLAFLAPAL